MSTLVEQPNVNCNGYRRWEINGTTVYHHRIITEQVIGRPLTSEESVHHIDEDRGNNDPSNLIVFRTRGDHALFHKVKSVSKVTERDLFKTQEGVYYCPEEWRASPRYCTNCGDPCDRQSTMCDPCSRKRRERIDWPPTRDLVRMVEESGYAAVGRNLGVSDNSVRKRIKNHPMDV